MRTLCELKTYANDEAINYKKQILDIHPMLLSILSLNDFRDPTLSNNELYEKFNDIKFKIKTTNNIIRDEAKKYYISLLNDMEGQGVNIGYNSDGSDLILDEHNFGFDLFYVPSVEMQAIFSSLSEFKSYIEFIPFWERSYQLLVPNKYGIKSYVDIKYKSDPINFITSSIKTIESAKCNDYNINDAFIMYNKVQLNTPYKMITAAISADLPAKTVLEEFNNTVRTHKIIEELLKQPSGFYKVESLNFNEKTQNLDIKVKKV